MSGGVDSSVAAAICLEKGYNVIGVTLKMKTCDDSREKTKSCCGLDDNIQARLVAQKLSIPHRFISVREEFSQKILKYAWDEYKSGRTPNPCILCNHYLKFGAMLGRFGQELGAQGIITGHYAVIDRSDPEKARMFKGTDPQKDQTYFLSALTQEQLNSCYMPLGDITKTEVREIAARLELPNASKQESQDACFGYKGETFAFTLSRYFNETMKPGAIVDESGSRIGEHPGLAFFTVGQRKGLGIALGQPAYVIRLDPVKNQVVVSTDQKLLLCRSFTATDMSWLDFDHDELECMVQTRYRQALQPAVVKRNADQALIELKQPLAAVTPGQRLVIYHNNQMLGGGWINETKPVSPA